MQTRQFRTWAKCALAAAALAVAASAPAGAQPKAQVQGQNYGGAYGAFTMPGDDRVGLNPGNIVAGDLRRSGAELGLLAGRRWAFRRAILAVEAELSVSGVGDSDRRGVYLSRSRTRAEAGLRLLLGQPLARGIAYVAAGAAWGQFDYRVTGGGAAIDARFVAPGYTAALGWQVPLERGWSLRSEWRATGYRGTVVGDGTFTTRATPTGISLRMALTRDF